MTKNPRILYIWDIRSNINPITIYICVYINSVELFVFSKYSKWNNLVFTNISSETNTM